MRGGDVRTKRQMKWWLKDSECVQAGIIRVHTPCVPSNKSENRVGTYQRSLFGGVAFVPPLPVIT